jgi:hypothetical protein
MLFVDGGNNKVGINDSSPAGVLSIKATDNSYSGGFRIEGTDETTALGITHVNGDNYFSGNATDDHLVLTGSGNVGIGTSSITNFSNMPNLTVGGSSGGMLTNQVNGTDGMRLYSNSSGTVLNETRNLYLQFATNNTERMRIHNSGVVSAPNGIELGSGLDATAANTLNDYEEGTWTPSLTASGGASSQGYASRVGSYTKIGNKVTANWRILLNAKGSLTGTTRISGLPFAGNASPIYNVASTMVGLIYLADDENFKAMQYAANSFLYLMIEKDDTALSQISGNGNFDNDSEISGSVTYFTNS